jgi:hypothetical protein
MNKFFKLLIDTFLLVLNKIIRRGNNHFLLKKIHAFIQVIKKILT